MDEPFSPEELARYRAALECLPRRTLAVFIAHRVDGMTYAEIATANGLSERRVRKLMRDAIARLHRNLKR